MSKQINTLTRRNFLKATAYTSALAASGLSSLSFANSAPTVTLLNQSNRAFVLDAAQPVSLKKIQGWVAVKLNQAPEHSSTEISNDNSITLAAGQQRSFTIDSELAPALKEAGGYIFIDNELSELDNENTLPMATFDVVIV